MLQLYMYDSLLCLLLLLYFSHFRCVVKQNSSFIPMLNFYPLCLSKLRPNILLYNCHNSLLLIVRDQTSGNSHWLHISVFRKFDDFNTMFDQMV